MWLTVVYPVQECLIHKFNLYKQYKIIVLIVLFNKEKEDLAELVLVNIIIFFIMTTILKIIVNIIKQNCRKLI